MNHIVYLADSYGNRLAVIDQFISLTYARVVNNPGAFVVTLPESFDASVLTTDARIEIWRTPWDGMSGPLFQMAGILRKPEFVTDAKGLTTLSLTGVGLTDLLADRIVAYAADTAQASKSAKIDDMMKAIVRENLGSSAVAARDLSAVGLSVQGNLGLGATTTKGFAWRKVLDVLQELHDESLTTATPIYFEIEPITSTTFEFRTYANQRGVDHSNASSAPVLVGIDFGNLSAPSLSEDHTDECDYVYAGGQGEGSARTIIEVADVARTGQSAFGRRERFVDARNESTTAGVTSAANAALSAGKPRKKFQGTLTDTASYRYGIEWGYGDKVTAVYRGVAYTAMVKAVTITVSADGAESIDARLEVLA